MDKFLTGKTALVTGAGSGIGRAIAVKLADLGARVAVTDINPASANETKALLSGEGHMALELDVTKKEDIAKVLEEIVSATGSLYILVNNAGVSTMQWIEDLTEAEYDFNMDVNAKGVFLCMLSALPYLKETKGRIVNIASMAATKPAPILLLHYTASKFGVVGLTKSGALELAKYGITVNCVCPGFVKTSMQDRELIWEGKLRGMTPEEVRDSYINSTPLGRLCYPEDVADAVGFLVSPDSKFITGEELNVTGGANL